MGFKVVTLLLLLASASAQTSSPWVQIASGFITGLQRNPTTLSSCQTLLAPLATKWEAAATSVVGLDAWESLYDLRDFFTALDFWTQTCNFVTLFNYVKLNMTWNLLFTRIATNLTFYAVRNTQSAWSTMLTNYNAASYAEAGKVLGQLVSKTISFNLN